MARYRIDGFGDEHYLFVFDDEDGSVRISGYIDAVNFPIIENKSCIVTKVRLLGFKLIIDTFYEHALCSWRGGDGSLFMLKLQVGINGRKCYVRLYTSGYYHFNDRIDARQDVSHKSIFTVARKCISVQIPTQMFWYCMDCFSREDFKGLMDSFDGFFESRINLISEFDEVVATEIRWGKSG